MPNSVSDDPHRPNGAGWLSGHPIIDPKHNAPDFPKADVGGWNSGPMLGEVVREQMVTDAVEALAAFAGDVRRDRALRVLKEWVRFPDMTRPEVHAVLDTCPGSVPGAKKSEPGE